MGTPEPPTLEETLRRIREKWKAEAEALVKHYSDDELTKVHAELVQESNMYNNGLEDVLILINAVRAEYGRRLGSG